MVATLDAVLGALHADLSDLTIELRLVQGAAPTLSQTEAAEVREAAPDGDRERLLELVGQSLEANRQLLETLTRRGGS